jgi:hypothetical protein
VAGEYRIGRQNPHFSSGVGSSNLKGAPIVEGTDFGRIAGLPEAWRIEAEELPQILRRSAPQDDNAGNCLFLFIPLGYLGYLGYSGYSNINNLRLFSRRKTRVLMQKRIDSLVDCFRAVQCRSQNGSGSVTFGANQESSCMDGSAGPGARFLLWGEPGLHRF